MSPVLREAGFERMPDPSDSGWMKEQRVSTLPHAWAHLAEAEGLSEGMFAQTTIREGWIELRIPSADYREGPALLSSDWGQSLLTDALAHSFDQPGA